MKRYRLPLFIATLFALWLFFGREIINRVLNPEDGETVVIDGLPEGLGGRLIYTQGRDGVWQIDLASGDRSIWWQLPGVGYVSGITASPDASAFVVAYEPQMPDNSLNSSTDLYLLDDPPEQAIPIIERDMLTEVYEHPHWSADGAWIYFAHYILQLSETGAVEGFTQTIERLPADAPDTAPQLIINDGLEFYVDDTLLQAAYVYFDPQTFGYSVRVADADGGNVRVLVAENTFERLSSPRISPDGAFVYFSASGEPRTLAHSDLGQAQAHGAPWDVWRVEISSGATSRVTNLGIDGPSLAWSPDGASLAIVALEGVYVLDIEADDVYRVGESTAEGEIIWIDG